MRRCIGENSVMHYTCRSPSMTAGPGQMPFQQKGLRTCATFAYFRIAKVVQYSGPYPLNVGFRVLPSTQLDGHASQIVVVGSHAYERLSVVGIHLWLRR